MVIGLGTPDPTGNPQSPVWHSMVPGSCCYDSSRPSWMPSWLETSAEIACLSSTGNCSVGTIAATPPPTSACAGTISVDANGNQVCTAAAGVNDPNATQGQLSTGGQDFQAALSDWVTGTTNSATVGTSTPMWVWLALGAVVLFGAGFIGGKR